MRHDSRNPAAVLTMQVEHMLNDLRSLALILATLYAPLGEIC